MIALITGGTSGIGKETARALCRRGDEVTIVGRNRTKTESVAREIGASFLIADFSSLASVRALAESAPPGIDALISNAGVFVVRKRLSADGIEETFAVNHLAPFLLVNLLRDRLEPSNARIVVVASAAHLGASIAEPRRYTAWSAYSRSKLANVMFTYAMARRLKRATINCLHPGFVRTRLGSGNRVPVAPIMALLTPFTISAGEAAGAPVWLATAPELDGVTGRYFDRYREAFSSKASYDLDAQEELWESSARLCGLS